MSVQYGQLEVMPLVWLPSGKVVCFTPRHKAWREINSADAAVKGRLMEKSRFDRSFPDLPAIPETCPWSDV